MSLLHPLLFLISAGKHCSFACGSFALEWRREGVLRGTGVLSLQKT